MSVNVLVVDDSDVIRRMILKTLDLAEVPLGDAYEAANGQEALDIIDSQWVDVVIADINMPVMDGIEMLRRLRADQRFGDLPVIVVTTEGSSERVAELEAAGVSAYVRKPFTPETIRDVVDTVTRCLTSTSSAKDVVPVAFIEVLERFVMMDAALTATDSMMPAAQERLLNASMTFRGGASGEIALAAPFATALEMAANAIGIDEDDPLAHEKAADALAEVLNMTCGAVVLSVEPEKPTNLTPPVVESISSERWAEMQADDHTTAFVVSGRPALLSCRVKSER